jgi:hypothetical protein
MTEEITEDNCVLSENDLLNIDTSLFMMGGRAGANSEESKLYFERLFQKITKLNDLAKINKILDK